MFTSIRANPFLWWELRQGSTAKGINWSFIWLRVIPLSFLTLVALIPVFYYIDDSRVDWLPLMAIILFLPRPILAIRTLFMGIQSVRQDMIQGRWEPLILTGIPARKIVWRKWVKVVRQTFPDQILFSLPTIGLAVGLSQFFQSTVYDCFHDWTISPLYPKQIIDLLFHPYCYNTNYQLGKIPSLNPSTVVLMLGIILIIIVGFFEGALNASIGLSAGLSRFAAKGLGVLYGLGIRFILLIILFLSIPLMQDNANYNFNCGNFIIIRKNICPYSPISMVSMEFMTSFYRAYDTTQLAVMPLLDQGTLLTANIMRPKDDRMLQVYIRQSRYPASEISIFKSNYDNRPFVLRNLIAATISGFLYWLLIRYFLRRATRLAIVNHGASGYLEL